LQKYKERDLSSKWIRMTTNAQSPNLFLEHYTNSDIHQEFNDKAKTFNLEAVIYHILAFLQYETLILQMDEKIHIYIHIPVVDLNKKLYGL
jgi:hypothetical protein